MFNDWLIGEAARLSLAVTDAAGAAADPGALRLKVKRPAGTVATYTYGVGAEIVRDSVGVFRADILLDEAGPWVWRWECDAPNAGATEGTLQARKSAVL